MNGRGVVLVLSAHRRLAPRVAYSYKRGRAEPADEAPMPTGPAGLVGYLLVVGVGIVWMLISWRPSRFLAGLDSRSRGRTARCVTRGQDRPIAVRGIPQWTRDNRPCR
jgi:hypothetical protein